MRALQPFARWFRTAKFKCAKVRERCENHSPPIRVLCEKCKYTCTRRKGNRVTAKVFFFRIAKGNEGIRGEVEN